MNDIDRNLLMLSGRLRALEHLVAVFLIDNSLKSANPLATIDAARRDTLLTYQMQRRPVDQETDLEAGAMGDALNEIFDLARAELIELGGGA